MPSWPYRELTYSNDQSFQTDYLQTAVHRCPTASSHSWFPDPLLKLWKQPKASILLCFQSKWRYLPEQPEHKSWHHLELPPKTSNSTFTELPNNTTSNSLTRLPGPSTPTSDLHHLITGYRSITSMFYLWLLSDPPDVSGVLQFHSEAPSHVFDLYFCLSDYCIS